MGILIILALPFSVFPQDVPDRENTTVPWTGKNRMRGPSRTIAVRYN
jgi:hypothetical protein